MRTPTRLKPLGYRIGYPIFYYGVRPVLRLLNRFRTQNGPLQKLVLGTKARLEAALVAVTTEPRVPVPLGSKQPILLYVSSSWMPARIPCNGELEAKARTAPHITTGLEL